MTLPSPAWWRTLLVTLPAVVVLTVAAGVAALATTLFDRSGHAAHRLAQWWGRGVLAAAAVRVRVRGLDALVPGATYVFVANHQSLYDIPVLFGSIPYQIRIIAKQSLGPIPFVGWHLRRAGHILVDRAHPDREGILRRWRGLVGEGLSLIIFPEGTRSADGTVRRFKSGSFTLALQAGLPVVPLSIAGTRHVMRKGEFTVRPGVVSLVVHPPIETRGRAAEPGIEDVRAFAAEVRAIVAGGVEALERAGTA
ncbi:MAG TPA: lysophospholipid acyltransferase family protein [Vicinamibacterales bacterium]|nr:lysophospholipid acyltransferase family protein [Vicinamibacterales bacterium]HPW21599.1 lysophospholipid acyltransferase family protein [Vicinamibacterales bacterium]